MANVNQYNFLRWRENDLPAAQALPNAYTRERCQLDYMPVFVPGEKVSFYINTQNGMDYPNPETLRLKYVSASGVVTGSVALNIDVLDVGTGKYNLYKELTVPALLNGFYELVIYQGADIFMRSNLIRVMNSGYSTTTSLVTFKNDRNMYNVRYGDVVDLYQQFRLHITEVNMQFEEDVEVYQSSTSGRRRNLLSMPQKYHTFESYYFDKEAHEAAACMVMHSTVQINTATYAFKTGYKFDPILLSKKTKGEFEMYNQAFATVNKC